MRARVSSGAAMPVQSTGGESTPPGPPSTRPASMPGPESRSPPPPPPPPSPPQAASAAPSAIPAQLVLAMPSMMLQAVLPDDLLRRALDRQHLAGDDVRPVEAERVADLRHRRHRHRGLAVLDRARHEPLQRRVALEEASGA